MLRNKFGRFMKRGKKRHHARRRTNPHRRHVKRHRVKRHHRRRSNPHLLLANPRGGAASKRIGRARSLASYRIDPVIVSRPGRRRKAGKRARYRMYRSRPGKMPRYRVVRRANPWGSWFKVVRFAAAGGLGIVAARVFGKLYSDNIGTKIAGTDASSFRAIVSEALRIVAMGAGPILTERIILRRLPVLTPDDRSVFVAGALAEAGRQGIGVIITKARPTFDKARWGLDGPNAYVAHQDDGTFIYGLDANNQWWRIGHSMQGLIARGNMSGVVPSGTFGALTNPIGDEDYDDAETA